MNEPNESTTAIELSSPRNGAGRTVSLLGPSNFELAQRMATALSKSTLIPKEFQDNLPNCLIALEMAHRMGASPMMVMQNLYIVHGKPAWSSQFVIAAINSTGRFSPLRFDMKGEGDKRECFAWAKELGTGERLEGPNVSMAMAKAEGWSTKNGSKWQTLPELMLRYRAATFFGRLYAPEVLMGMKEESEVVDIDATVAPAIARPVIGNGVASAPPAEPPKDESTPRKKRGPGKLKQKESPPTPAELGPNAQEVAKRLEEEKFSIIDLALVCLRHEWIDAPAGYQEGNRESLTSLTLADFGEDKLADILDIWDNVADQMKALPQPQAGS